MPHHRQSHASMTSNQVVTYSMNYNICTSLPPPPPFTINTRTIGNQVRLESTLVVINIKANGSFMYSRKIWNTE